MAGVRFTSEAAARIAEATRHTLANRAIDPAVGGTSVASTAEAYTARCTSVTPDPSGNYYAVVSLYSAPLAKWVDYGACRLKMPNGGAPVTGSNYVVLPAGTTPEGDALYVVAATSTQILLLTGGPAPAGLLDAYLLTWDPGLRDWILVEAVWALDANAGMDSP